MSIYINTDPASYSSIHMDPASYSSIHMDPASYTWTQLATAAYTWTQLATAELQLIPSLLPIVNWPLVLTLHWVAISLVPNPLHHKRA